MAPSLDVLKKRILKSTLQKACKQNTNNAAFTPSQLCPPAIVFSKFTQELAGKIHALVTG